MNVDRMAPFPVHKIALVGTLPLNTYMRPIDAANDSGKAPLYKKALLYLLPFCGCWWPSYELVLFSTEGCWNSADDSGNCAFWNATHCITYHPQKTTTYDKTKGNKKLFLGFQSMVSFGSPFKIRSERVGNILNWVMRKSVAWLDLSFRESVEQVVIEVKISVTPSIYRTNTAKKQINRHVVLLILQHTSF